MIFPEHNAPHNHIICDFQKNFVDIAKLYYRRTGKELCFVPLYIAPSIKQMHLGAAIRYNSQNPVSEERDRICNYLMEEITQIASDLPEHTVVPYQNISPKKYGKNRDHQQTESIRR